MNTARSTRSTRSTRERKPKLSHGSPVRPTGEGGGASEEVMMLRQQLAEATWLTHATIHAVEGLLLKLRLPTLKHTLQDLGLPADGKKDDLAKRIIGALHADTPRSPRHIEWR